MILLLFFVFGCSVTKVASEASIKIDGKPFQVQYVFDSSEVHLSWRYELTGFSKLPTVKFWAVIKGNEYDPILTLTGNRSPIYFSSPYKGRVTGSRNMSSASIILKNFIPDDYTNYKMTVEHTLVKNPEESVISLQAGVKPTKPIIKCKEIQGNVSSIELKEGDDLECSCTSNGLPVPSVVWELPGARNNGSVLKKENISKNEANSYKCIANNQYGFYNQSFLDVKVQYPPSIPQVTSSSESSYIGQMVIFNCTGSGDPPPFYSWITPDNHTLTGNSTLVVLLRNSRQFGVYMCITKNIIGHATRNITLTQLLFPGKPRISFTAKTFEISVTWSKLDDNGGSDVTSYYVRVSKGTHVIADNVTTEMQYEIDKLERNTTYKFCIRAKNIVGVGNETCKDISTLFEGIPNIPAKPRLTVGDQTLIVKWNKVFGSPDHYFVEYKIQNEGEWVRSGQLGTKKLEYEILNVTPRKIYYVRIVAGNAYGSTTGNVAERMVPTRRTPHTHETSPGQKSTSSTNEPVLGENTDEIPSTFIAVSLVLGLLVVVAVVFLVFWLKRRSAANYRNEPDIEHVEGPLGDLYAVVEGKTKKDGKSDRKDLVYAELSDFDRTVNRSILPTQHHTEYADIAHVITGTDNDYEDIPPRSYETEYASVSLNRQNSISV